MMAEYIERDSFGTWLRKQKRLSKPLVIMALEETPPADVVPVVRCKDCKHKGWIQEPCHRKSVDFCHVWDACINNPDKCFCYYGETKPSIPWEAD